MNILYSDHAKLRMRQKGVSELEIEYIIAHPTFVKNSYDSRRIALGTMNYPAAAELRGIKPRRE